jgi:hypothetical protein
MNAEDEAKPSELSRKRGCGIISRLVREMESRLGNKELFGETTLRIRWQAGEISFAKIANEEDLK